jgi:hypothetical protein
MKLQLASINTIATILEGIVALGIIVGGVIGAVGKWRRRVFPRIKQAFRALREPDVRKVFIPGFVLGIAATVGVGLLVHTVTTSAKPTGVPCEVSYASYKWDEEGVTKRQPGWDCVAQITAKKSVEFFSHYLKVYVGTISPDRTINTVILTRSSRNKYYEQCLWKSVQGGVLLGISQGHSNYGFIINIEAVNSSTVDVIAQFHPTTPSSKPFCQPNSSSDFAILVT